ncbi:MAG TPA: helix-turn-helix transcriptional regulator [Aliidongia sp.]|nr:helix-turn-helix transcriptional regulator [Aliidongia sp.]
MTPETHHIRWRLGVMMAERKITSVAELARRLNDRGVSISSKQLARVVHHFPERINSRLLVALPGVLQCDLTDLMVYEPIPANQRDEPPGHTGGAVRKSPRRSRRGQALDDLELLGPSFDGAFVPPKRGGR